MVRRTTPWSTPVFWYALPGVREDVADHGRIGLLERGISSPSQPRRAGMQPERHTPSGIFASAQRIIFEYAKNGLRATRDYCSQPFLTPLI
jgi:hypothetical protein